MNTYLLGVTIGLCLLIIVTRALPFWFGRYFKDNEMLAYVGKALPAYVMMLLVLYEIKLDSFVVYPYALPALISLGIVVMMHIWLRQVLLSMSVGTASFILLKLLFAA